MKNRPIHENLDTSFVNLSALIKYLRRRQFIGNVRVELGTYEADLVFTPENLRVREYDHIAGRISEGDEALERLLIRAREPGGNIHVFQSVEELENSSVFRDEEIGAEKPVRSEGEKSMPNAIAEQNGNAENNGNSTKANPKVSHFPFELSNQVELKARQTNVSDDDWQTLLDLIAELLGTIDLSLAEANLDFRLAFEKARFEISDDYPFLHPVSGIFDYKNGKISMEEQVSAPLFVAGINETLRRILDKLGRNPKFTNIYRAATQNVLALIHQRKPLYDKFSVTPTLEKTVGT